MWPSRLSHLFHIAGNPAAASCHNEHLLQVAFNLQKLILGAPTDNLWMSGNWTSIGLEAFKKRLPDVHVQLVFA